jgi:hypothetical protein
MMGIMALITRCIILGTILFIPVPVNPSMNTGFPVPVGHPVAFSAETRRLVFWNHTAIMIGKCIREIIVVTIETSKIQAVGKKHILMCPEGKV